MNGLMDMFRGMFTGTPDGVGPMQPEQQGIYDALFSDSQDGMSPMAKYGMQSGMGAANQYRDVSQGASLPGLMGMATQGIQREQQQRPGQPYINQYLTGLMGR